MGAQGTKAPHIAIGNFGQPFWRTFFVSMPSMRGVLLFMLGSMCACEYQTPAGNYSREQLQSLTKFRSQHRRTIDGRLCAAAFVQDRQTFTDCTATVNPSGEAGREWCYVEPQVQAADAVAWNYCAPAAHYDKLRAESNTRIIA